MLLLAEKQNFERQEFLLSHGFGLVRDVGVVFPGINSTHFLDLFKNISSRPSSESPRVKLQHVDSSGNFELAFD